MSEPASLYEAVGGMDFFVRLVDAFYERVAADPPLLDLYPEPDDLAPARERLTLFLAQYWGGPATYSETRGHPRLRMRHMPFAIDADAHDRWLVAMAGAIDTVDPHPDVRRALHEYFTMAAEAMRNQ